MRTAFGLLASAIAVLLLGGCVTYNATYNGIKPLHPKPLGMFSSQLANSTSPKFQWEATPHVKTYDLSVWKAEKVTDMDYEPADLVCHREGIATNEYQLDITLAPSSVFYWSVKPSGARDWSTVSTKMDVYVGSSKQRRRTHEYFIFFTPKDKK